MKQLLTILALLLALISCNKVDVQSEIIKDYNEYVNLASAKKIDEALNYTNPRLFEFIPREQMKNSLLSIYNMPNIEYKTGEAKFLKFEELKTIESINYVKCRIISPLEMKFTAIENTEENISQLLKDLTAEFGAGNVEFDKESGFYKIKAEKEIIASSENDVDWKFVIIDGPKSKILLEKFIPKELLN